jgi:hypothetical protein
VECDFGPHSFSLQAKARIEVVQVARRKIMKMSRGPVSEVFEQDDFIFKLYLAGDNQRKQEEMMLNRNE